MEVIELKLPFDILSQNYIKPRLFLCEVDKTKICQLETTELSGNFKFNAYSELTFTVGRTYINIITGETQVNPYYDKIEALRLVYLEGFGYFEIQDPEIISDGLQEVKNVTAYGYEYTLSQKYLEEFYVNTGKVNDIGVNEDGSVTVIPLYDPGNKGASLLNLILEKIYGWKIGHVDSSIASMSRKFEISRASVYDFIVQDICEKFNCFAVFDTEENTINLYAEALSTKFIGDGITNTFVLSSPYETIGSVTIDSYKTTEYLYDYENKTIILNTIPNNGALIEVVDGSQQKWMTDVYVTFDNLAQEINISYSADDIKTVLTVKGADNLDIREVNMGLPYLVDLSYYYSIDWMGQDLFDAYTTYLQKCNDGQATYKENSEKILELNNSISYEQNRVSLQYSIADHVTSTTVGKYYIRGGSIILTEEQKEIAEIMKAEFDQTAIDLTIRPQVSWERMHEAGWDTEEGSYSTLDTVTFLSSDFDVLNNSENTYAINVTPILPNGYVIKGGHDGLWNYINEQLENDVKFEEMRDIFLGIYNSLAEAEQAAERLHVLQEQFYQYGFPVPNYYYTEVSLPADYKAGVDYYTLLGNDLDETKFSHFYEALKVYFNSQDDKDVSKITDLQHEFRFMSNQTMETLADELKNADTLDKKNIAITNFLDEMWDQLGKNPLDSLYYKPYTTVKETNEEAGWNDTNNENYWLYYPVTLVLKSLEDEIKQRDDIITGYEDQVKKLQSDNSKIASDASIYTHFTNEQLIRLSAFLREDEYTDDNFVRTDVDTTETLMQTKQELAECGRIELSKLCSPKLAFSMDMANIYALPEFEPIIHQFQLGNLINVAIRQDYIKRARLLEVNINFDDFSDFTCEFGELTSLRTPSSIHADLLANALSAGKSVATNASYWNQGSDTATALSLLIQKGLLDAATTIKAIDGSQGVEIDKYGIHLRKYSPSTGELDPKEGWLVNNQFLYSDDNFKTTKSVFGEYQVNGETFWGLLAEAVQAGYVVGCLIEGGTIKIGLQGNGQYAFEVREDGSVIMNGNNRIEGYVTENDLSDIYNMKENIDQNFEFNKTNGLTIGQTDNAFYVNITSQEMGFYDNSDTNSPNQKVVNIGNKSATIQNAVFQGSGGTQFENNVTFKQQINISKPNATAGFAWKLEENGSLSLAIIS